MFICNRRVDLKNALTCTLDNVQLLKGGEGQIVQAIKKYAYPGAVAFNLHSSVGEHFSVSNSAVGYHVNSNYEYDLTYNNCALTFVRCTPYDVKEFVSRRRTYNNCRLYLNNADSDKYYIDNLANYVNCDFIPCSDMEVGFYGKDIDVKFLGCTSKRKKGVLYTKSLAKVRLERGRFDGKNWLEE